MFDSLFTQNTSTTTSIYDLLTVLGVSLVLGFAISLCYIFTHRDKTAAQNTVLTLVMLPAVITIIIMLVGNNFASAFSLAGVFTIVRFRSVPGDPKDITYILFSAAVGLSCGLGYIIYAAIAAATLCGVLVVMELTKYGKPRTVSKLLKVTMPENLDFQHCLDDVLERHTVKYKLDKIKTADLGSLFELHYTVVMKDDTNEKSFIDELRCRNGNLNITLVMSVAVNEFL